MNEKILVVVDMQNDFVTGSLGTKEAQAIVPQVVPKIESYQADGGVILVTQDTHEENYLETQEGRNLPVKHCIRDSWGWQLVDEIAQVVGDAKRFEKETFGSRALIRELAERQPESVEFVGLCTDICVVSNVLGAKAWLPETPMIVDSACCAGVTPESHKAALETMRSCQVEVL